MFDFEPAFPCSALFLDCRWSLLLTAVDETNQKFERVGIARFEQTERQKISADQRTQGYYTVDDFAGPITRLDTCTNVQIV